MSDAGSGNWTFIEYWKNNSFEREKWSSASERNRKK